MHTPPTPPATDAFSPVRLHPYDGSVRERLLTPLNIAAYITWIAVSLSVVDFGNLRAGDPREWAGVSALIAFAILLTVCVVIDRRNAPGTTAWLAVIQGVLTVIAEAFLYGGQTSVLLIIVAGQLVLLWPLRAFVAVMLAFNLTLGALWLSHSNSMAQPLLSLLMIGGFQAFAALTGHYAGSRERAREHLAQVNAELLATRFLLEESARAGERLKLSRELHDVAGHTLTALKLNLLRLDRDAALGAREEVHTSIALADELLSQIRQVVGTLRAYDGLDLRASLQALTHPVPGVEIALDIEDSLRVDDLDQAEALLRCAQESITNALRHGRARRIDIRLHRNGDAIELRVDNDGLAPAKIEAGNGLTGMRERLAALGGELVVASTPPRGLGIVARIPLHNPSPLIGKTRTP